MKAENEKRAQDAISHTYQMDAATRRWFYGFSFLFVAFFAVLTVLNQVGIISPAPTLRDRPWIDIFPFVFAIWVCERTNRKVILSEEAIELTSWVSKRKFRREEILGYRMGRLPVRVGGSSFYIVVPSRGKEMRLPPFLNADRYFDTWMLSLPKVEK
jgi:hypothetical protein